MEIDELYDELSNYIFYHCDQFFSQEEQQARRHLDTAARFEGVDKMPKMMLERGWISSDPAVLQLTKNGFEVFKKNVVERIFKTHRQELNLNLCPNCNKIARTPKARQCRFCRHDWH